MLGTLNVFNILNVTGYYYYVYVLGGSVCVYFIGISVHRDSFQGDLCFIFVISIWEVHDPSAFEVQMFI
jgi:hypothetical protein